MFENMNQIVLDVSEDEAPVPLQRAINSLSSINENTYMRPLNISCQHKML